MSKKREYIGRTTTQLGVPDNKKKRGGVSPTRIDLNLKHIHWIYEIRGDVQTYREKGRWVII